MTIEKAVFSFYIPKASFEVQDALRNASKLSQEEGFSKAHFLSTAYTTKAVALSILNIPLYLAFGIYQFAIFFAALNVTGAWEGLGENFASSLKSVVLVVLGIFYMIGSLFFPRQIARLLPISFQPIEKALPLIPTPEPQNNLVSKPGLPAPLAASARSILDESQLTTDHSITVILDLEPPHSLQLSAASVEPVIAKQPKPAVVLPNLNPVVEVSSGSSERGELSIGVALDPKPSNSASSLNRLGSPAAAVVPLMAPVAPSLIPELQRLNDPIFLGYVQRHAPGYDKTYKTLVCQGYRFVKELQNNSSQLEKSPPKERMASFVWYLTYLAHVRYNKAFEEGMFVFEDKDDKIHNFFLSDSHQRTSTHYPSRRITSVAIDSTQDGKKGLPGGHQTCHFGQLKMLNGQGHYMFLKPEKYGVQGSQVMGHALQYVQTRINHMMGTPSSIGQFKEHIPSKVLEEFWALYDQIPSLKESRKKNETLVNDYGIAAMNQILRDYEKNILPSHADRSKIAQFLEPLEKQYGDLSLRKGEEVVLRNIFEENFDSR